MINSLEKEFKARRMLGGSAKIVLEELEDRLTKLQAARTLLLNQLEMTAGMIVTNYSIVNEVLIIDEVES